MPKYSEAEEVIPGLICKNDRREDLNNSADKKAYEESPIPIRIILLDPRKILNLHN